MQLTDLRPLTAACLAVLVLGACAGAEKTATSDRAAPAPVDESGVSSSLQRDEGMFLRTMEEQVPYMVEGLPDAELIAIGDSGCEMVSDLGLGPASDRLRPQAEANGIPWEEMQALLNASLLHLCPTVPID